jgi:hypothetical protein
MTVVPVVIPGGAQRRKGDSVVSMDRHPELPAAGGIRRRMDRVRIVSAVAILLAALSFAPSYAHVLEAPPRLLEWPPELWREATVFRGQFALFATVGAPVEIAAILACGTLCVVLRGQRPAFRLAAAGTFAFVIALVLWFGVVNVANGRLATWRPGPLPADFADVQLRWEAGHITIAAVKAVGLLLIVCAGLAGAARSRLHSSPR